MTIEIRDLQFQLSDFSFGPRSFECDDHGLYLVRGKNGSGKTSLLRCLLGRIRKTKGEISGLRFPIGTCGVEPLFIGSWTVQENIEWLYQLAGFSVPSENLKYSYAHRRFDRLSLGQRRQTELEFVLQLPVKTLFLDEPFTHLDQDHLKKAADQIQRASESRLVLMTSHQEIETLKYKKVFEL